MKILPRLVGFIAILFVITSFRGKDFAPQSYYIVIDKTKYELSVFDNQGWLVTFPVVFGSRDLSDKAMEGDKKTPEGTFTIVSKRVHEKWDRFLYLDYPNNESYEKFNYRKEHGLILESASIGGGIGIHGVWQHEDYAIDQYQDWTDGCISMKNKDVEELFSLIPVGTKVTIKR